MKHHLKFRDWIDINKIEWHTLSRNPNAIHLLEQNLDKINWTGLSRNENAISSHQKQRGPVQCDFLF